MERTTLTQIKRNDSMLQQRALALTVQGIAVALIASFYWMATFTLDVIGVVSVLLILFVIVNAISIFRGPKKASGKLNKVDWLRTTAS